MIFPKRSNLLLLLASLLLLGAAPPLVELDLGLGPDAVTRATPGYPRGLKPPHLREEVKRPPLMVPPGMENLALYRPISASDEEPITGDLYQINDDIKKSDPFDYVELGPGLQWVQVDLEARYEIFAVAVWHFYKNPVIYNDVILQASNDEAFQDEVKTLFNNDHDFSSGVDRGHDTAYYTRWWGELVDTRDEDGVPLRARFVRIYTGDGMEGERPRFVELAVYGAPDPIR